MGLVRDAPHVSGNGWFGSRGPGGGGPVSLPRHDEGRSLVWVLSQMRAMVEAQSLERIEARLAEIEQNPLARYQGTDDGDATPARYLGTTH